MTQREIQIEVIECGMTGEIGLAPQGANIAADDYMADTTGVLMAHDLLEHVNGPEHIGSIGDELMALGAIWYGRGETGNLNNRDNAGRYYTPEQNVASDISRMARDFSYKGFEFLQPEQTETDQDETFRYMIAYALKDARHEFNDWDEYREALPELRRYARNCLAFIQAGYNKAAELHECPYEYATLFWSVADALQPYAEHAEYVGQQYTLTIFDDGRVFIEEYFEDDGERGCDDCGEWFIPADDDEHTENQNGYLMCGDCVRKEESESE